MKRPIAAIDMPDVAPGMPATAAPVFMMVRPEELLVDGDYQRDLSVSSLRLIRRIVAGWDWRKFKAPNVAMTTDGALVIDGQHTATAAACHPDIHEIPVLVVEATEQRAQAEAFVGINRDRLSITAAQLHFANVAAGDTTAQAIDRVCQAAGVKVLRLPPSRAVYQPRETIAIAAIAGLLARQGEQKATEALAILAGAEIGPIQANHIRAVEHLLTDPEFADLDRGELARAIPALGIVAAEKEAKAFASTHCVPTWRGLASTWFKSAKKGKRRMPADAAPVPPASPVSISAAPPVAKNAAKRDVRPALGAWKPGPVMKRCPNCDETFIGDIKAGTCADCAYGGV